MAEGTVKRGKGLSWFCGHTPPALAAVVIKSKAVEAENVEQMCGLFAQSEPGQGHKVGLNLSTPDRVTVLPLKGKRAGTPRRCGTMGDESLEVAEGGHVLTADVGFDAVGFGKVLFQGGPLG